MQVLRNGFVSKELRAQKKVRCGRVKKWEEVDLGVVQAVDERWPLYCTGALADRCSNLTTEGCSPCKRIISFVLLAE